MKKYLPWFTISILLLFAIALVGCDGQVEDVAPVDENGDEAVPVDDEVYVLNFATVDVEDSVIGESILLLKEYLEDESNGRLNLEPYFGGALGGERDAAEGVSIGTVHLTNIDSGIVGGYDPAFYVLAMPYLFDDKNDYYSKLDGELGQILRERAEAVGFKLYGFSDAGTRQISNTKQTVRSPEDMSGMVLRVPESDISIKTFEAFGANPTPMDFGEIYTALQQGTIDGMENSTEILYTVGFMEVQDYLTLTGHQETPLPIIGSLEFYNSLPEDLQQILVDGIALAEQFNRERIQESEEDMKNRMVEEGIEITELSDEELEVFKQAVEPLYTEFTSIVGEDILQLAQ